MSSFQAFPGSIRPLIRLGSGEFQTLVPQAGSALGPAWYRVPAGTQVRLLLDDQPLQGTEQWQGRPLRLRRLGRRLELLAADDSVLLVLETEAGEGSPVLEGTWTPADHSLSTASGASAEPVLTGVAGESVLAAPALAGGGGSVFALGLATIAVALSAASEPEPPSQVSIQVRGSVVAGPLLADHGLSVKLYAADGRTLLATASIDPATGAYSATLLNYTGVVIAVVEDLNADADHRDEASLQPTDLDMVMSAVGVAQSDTLWLNINPLTTLAAQVLGLAEDGSVPAGLDLDGEAGQSRVIDTLAAFSQALGLSDLLADEVQATVLTDGQANPDANLYGQLLAALSGMNLAQSQGTQDSLDQLAQGMDLDAGALADAARSVLIKGAVQAGASASEVAAAVCGASNPIGLNLTSANAQALFDNLVSHLMAGSADDQARVEGLQSLYDLSATVAEVLRVTALADPGSVAVDSSLGVDELQALGLAGVNTDNLPEILRALARRDEVQTWQVLQEEVAAAALLRSSLAEDALAEADADLTDALQSLSVALAALSDPATSTELAAVHTAENAVSSAADALSAAAAAVTVAVTAAQAAATAASQSIDLSALSAAVTAAEVDVDAAAQSLADSETTTDAEVAKWVVLAQAADAALAFAQADLPSAEQALADALAALNNPATAPELAAVQTARDDLSAKQVALAAATLAAADALSAAEAAASAVDESVDLTAISDAVTAAETDGQAALAALGLASLRQAASADDATSTSPSVDDWTNAGLTGVTPTHLAALNSFLNLGAVDGAAGSSHDTLAELQTMVDAYLEIAAGAQGSDNNDTALDAAQITALALGGVIDSSAELSLFNDVLDQAQATAVDSATELADLADIVERIMVHADQGGQSISEAEFASLGLDAVALAGGGAAVLLQEIDGVGAAEVNSLQKLSVLFDRTPPTLHASTLPATSLSTVAGTAGDSPGETITLTVTFDSNVKGLSSGSDSSIFLLNGSSVSATWGGSDGSNTRTLTYTVQAGDSGSLTIDEAALKTSLLAAGITDMAGNALVIGGSIADIDATPLPELDTTAPTTAVATPKAVTLSAASTQYVSLPTTVGDVSGDLTLSTWVYIDGAQPAGARLYLFDFNNNTNGGLTENSNLYLAYQDGALVFRAANNTTFLLGSALSAPGGLVANTWHHVAVTVGGSSNLDVTLYLDGLSVATGTLTAAIAPVTRSNVNLGYTITSAPPSSFNGALANVLIYDDARTATEIQADMQGNVNLGDADLKGYYTFNNTTASANGSGAATLIGGASFGNDARAIRFSTDRGQSGADLVTHSASQTVYGELDAALQAGETVYVSVNGGSSWTAATASVGSTAWSASGLTLLAGAGQTVQVKVSDAAGNDGTVTSQSYSLDTTAPTLDANALPTYQLSTLSRGAGNSRNETISIQFTFNDAVYGLTSRNSEGVFTTGGTSRSATWSGVDGSNTRTLTYTILGHAGQAAIDETVLQTILQTNLTDAAGNGVSFASVALPNIDAVALPVVDGLLPVAVDLVSTTGGIQATESQYYLLSNAGAGKAIFPNMAASGNTDIAVITVTAGGAAADTANDKLVFGGVTKALDTTADSGTNLTINGVIGVDWSYSADKVLTLSKTGGGTFTAGQVQSIERGLQFQTSSTATQGDRTFTVARMDNAGNTGTASGTETVTVDTVAPTAVDLASGTAGTQASDSQYYNFSQAGTAQAIAPNVALASDTDLARITVTVGGAVADTANDTLVFGAASKVLNTTADSGSNLTINGVTGVDWSYSTGKVLTFTKNGGGTFSAADVQLIEQGLQFQTTSATQGSRTFSIAHVDLAGNSSAAGVETVTVDTALPTDVDLLSGTAGTQATDSQYYNLGHAGTSRAFLSNVALPSDTDLARITVTAGGAGADTANDKLVFGGVTKALDTTAGSGSNLTINGVTGVDWSYSTDKVLTLSKTGGGSFTAAQVQLIEQGLQFQTSATATQGDRTFSIAHVDLAGNTSTAAVETVMVDTIATLVDFDVGDTSTRNFTVATSCVSGAATSPGLDGTNVSVTDTVSAFKLRLGGTGGGAAERILIDGLDLNGVTASAFTHTTTLAGSQVTFNVTAEATRTYVFTPTTSLSAAQFELMMESLGFKHNSNPGTTTRFLLVSAFDAAGNSSTSTLNFTVDGTTPLVLDLNGDGVRTTALADGVLFDNTATGTPQRMGWTDGQDGLLVRDINQDGRIHNGSELFGSGTDTATGKAADGYAALAQHDANTDGVIDAQDAIFQELQVWIDANRDGVTDAGELKSLADLGIASLDLQAQAGTLEDNGNTLGLVSSWTDTSGQVHDMADVWFATQTLDEALVQALADGHRTQLAGNGQADELAVLLQDMLDEEALLWVVQADADDVLRLDDGGWELTGAQASADGHVFDLWSHGGAHLLIDENARVLTSL